MTQARDLADGKFDTNTLVVDAANNRIGIGTTSPARQLEIFDDGTAGQAVLALTAQNDENSRIMFADPDDNNIGIIDYKHSDDTMRFVVNNSERMHIGPTGNILHGKTSTSISTEGAVMYADGRHYLTKSSDDVIICNRLTDDGRVIRIFQDSTEEGYISVSGTTVSYQGGHLARLSQATDGNRISGLVKGTVMTNLDQMAVWSHDEVLWAADDDLPDGVSVGDVKTAAYTEDNEQLNCMAMSSVEGDTNVAGVFVNFDEEDDFNDMVIAMTGDMVIRIASDTTVARGDLLMSAGDGTAKPQGDGYVQDKTIAKVTSTTKSHTYDDGTYLVPCVLMAC